MLSFINHSDLDGLHTKKVYKQNKYILKCWVFLGGAGGVGIAFGLDKVLWERKRQFCYLFDFMLFLILSNTNDYCIQSPGSLPIQCLIPNAVT